MKAFTHVEIRRILSTKVSSTLLVLEDFMCRVRTVSYLTTNGNAAMAVLTPHSSPGLVRIFSNFEASSCDRMCPSDRSPALPERWIGSAEWRTVNGGPDRTLIVCQLKCGDSGRIFWKPWNQGFRTLTNAHLLHASCDEFSLQDKASRRFSTAVCPYSGLHTRIVPQPSSQRSPHGRSAASRT